MTVFQEAIYMKFPDSLHSLGDYVALCIKQLQSNIAYQWDFLLYFHLFSHGQNPTAFASAKLPQMGVQIFLG